MYVFLCRKGMIAIVLISISLSSCMVGPSFHAPTLANIVNAHEAAKSDWPESIVQINNKVASPNHHRHHDQSPSFVLNQPIRADWWTLFHSPTLNHWVEMGLRNNANLAAAKAALSQACFTLAAQTNATLLPIVSATFSASRNQTLISNQSNILLKSGVFNLFNAGISVAYTLDLFGGLHRQLEALGARVDFQAIELDAAFLSLSNNIMTTAITASALNEQIKVTQALIAAQEQQFLITRQRYHLGSATQTDVLLQRTQLETTRAALPSLQQGLATQLHVLSTLTGQFAQNERLTPIPFKELRLPRHLPLSMPSLLLRQRPDIRAAEATLHEASAQIGVATANLYPSISLNANYGGNSNQLHTLLKKNQRIFAIGPLAINVPIFQGNALILARKAAITAYEQAAAHYQQTVLAAFQNVMDVLSAIKHDQDLLRFKTREAQAAHEALCIAKKQYVLGGISYINVLIAEANDQHAQLDLIQAKSAHAVNTVALFQALGGGWWHHASRVTDLALIKNVSHYAPERFNQRSSK